MDFAGIAALIASLTALVVAIFPHVLKLLRGKAEADRLAEQVVIEQMVSEDARKTVRLDAERAENRRLTEKIEGLQKELLVSERERAAAVARDEVGKNLAARLEAVHGLVNSQRDELLAEIKDLKEELAAKDKPPMAPPLAGG